MEKRRMCPHCRAFISTDDKVCPYCETKVGQKAIERRLPADVGFIPAARFTTLVILLINAGMFVAAELYGQKLEGGLNEANFYLGAKSARLIFVNGEYWRLITAGFLHGGILHILMNSWVIFDLGTTVEEFYGTARYLVLYFLSTIAGFWASCYASPWASSVGASAGLFGLIGAMIAVGMRNRGTSLGAAMKAHYTQWAIWGVAIGLLPGFQTDNAAHIGGLAAGFVVGYLTGTPSLFDNWTEKAWKVAAAICVLLTIAAFAFMVRNLVSP